MTRPSRVCMREGGGGGGYGGGGNASPPLAFACEGGGGGGGVGNTAPPSRVCAREVVVMVVVTCRAGTWATWQVTKGGGGDASGRVTRPVSLWVVVVRRWWWCLAFAHGDALGLCGHGSVGR
jgi:hypothetical protein